MRGILPTTMDNNVKLKKNAPSHVGFLHGCMLVEQCRSNCREGWGEVDKNKELCLQAPVIYIHGIATCPSTLAAIFCVLLHRPFMVSVHGGLMPEHVDMIKRQKPHKWL